MGRIGQHTFEPGSLHAINFTITNPTQTLTLRYGVVVVLMLNGEPSPSQLSWRDIVLAPGQSYPAQGMIAMPTVPGVYTVQIDAFEYDIQAGWIKTLTFGTITIASGVPQENPDIVILNLSWG